jgi:predicted transcriptional regulator of viral defense system
MSTNMMLSIRRRIHAKGRGWVFTPREFADLGARAAVDQALSRLHRSSEIRRLTRGIYEFPRIHPQIGLLSPSAEAIATAAAAKAHCRVTVSEAKAANLLGLSTQVPAQNVFLTDGRSRTLRIGNQTVVLKHVAPSKLLGAGTEAGIVFQAIRAFGPQRVNEIPVEVLAEKLPAAVKSEVKRLAPSAPGWSQRILNRIAA